MTFGIKKPLHRHFRYAAVSINDQNTWLHVDLHKMQSVYINMRRDRLDKTGEIEKFVMSAMLKIE